MPPVFIGKRIFKIMLDDCIFWGYIVIMKMMDIIRKEIANSDKTRYRISKDTGIQQAVLCRVLQGGSLKAESAENLLRYFGYSIKKERR